MYPEIKLRIESLLPSIQEISSERQQQLLQLSSSIKRSLKQYQQADIVVICTHNSRRSHLAQLWIKAAAKYFQVEGIKTYSGGVEVTRFHPHMLDALMKSGFHVTQLDQSKNPKYYLPIADDDFSLDIYYSKIYSESYNPQENFIAVLVCSEAAEACPLVQGALERISLPYEDPKQADGTDAQERAYLQKVDEIGREMLFMMQALKEQLNRPI